MSLTETTIPGKNFSVPQNAPLVENPVQLNEVFRECIHQFNQPGDSQIIVRCESLPAISGDADDFSVLFNTLISLIRSTTVSGSKLFLYVDCEENKTGTGKDTVIHYNLRFHTNFSTNDDWKEQHREQLLNCKNIISKYQGKFMVNNISNTGCLFFITLPGKSQR